MRKRLICLLFMGILAAGIFGCSPSSAAEKSPMESATTEDSLPAEPTPADTVNSDFVTEGKETYRGFVIDNVLHSANDGEIHYHVYIPESYDGEKAYALYFTLPGYGGLYFQGVAQNLKTEDFGFEAQKYNDDMIIVTPQLSDWGETSADQTIALVEYFLDYYNIDRARVYASGFSGGGQTMSIAVGKRPDLFSAYLQVSSQWDGDFEAVAEEHLPVYFAIGENDEYYTAEPSKFAYRTLYALYEKQGLSHTEIDKLLVLNIKDHSYFTERGISKRTRWRRFVCL